MKTERTSALALIAAVLALCGFAATASAKVAFDQSFGTNGTEVSSGLMLVGGASLAPDGKFAVAGSSGNMPMSFSVARYTADGKPDGTFGSSGFVNDAIPGSDLSGYWQARATDVAVQPDNKLVVVGMYQVGSVKSLAAIVRLNANGTPDTDFGADGRVLIELQDSAQADAVQLAPNGDILVGGTSFSNSPYYSPNVIAIRLNSSGDPVGFGGDGIASTNLTANAMIWTSDVLVDGTGVLVAATRGNQISLTRFKADGELDASYGVGGAASAAFPDMSGSGRATKLADGRVIVAGSSGSGFALARFTAAGQLDPTYAFGGMLTLGFTGASAAADVAVRGNGKVIAVGRQGDLQGNGGPITIAMAGTTPEGLRDDSFGASGRVTTQLPLVSSSSAGNALLDAQGRLLVVGTAGYSGVGMARYLVDDLPGEGSPGASLDADFPWSIKSSKLKSLDGDLEGTAAKVQVAMRLNLSKSAKGVHASKSTRRCQWLKSSKAKFSAVKKKTGCVTKTWLRARVSASGHWKFALKKRLPKGSYTVFVRALNDLGAATAQLERPLKVK